MAVRTRSLMRLRSPFGTLRLADDNRLEPPSRVSERL
jgi:hypothetical protein